MVIFPFTFFVGFPDELRKIPTRFRFSSPSVGRSGSGCEHGQQVQVTPWWQHVTRTTSLELCAEASRWLQRASWTTDREVQRFPRIEHRAYEVDGRNRDSQWIYGSFFSQYSANESSLWTREGKDVIKLYCTFVTKPRVSVLPKKRDELKKVIGGGGAVRWTCISSKGIAPLHDPVTLYGINYAGTQIAQWYFQNKGTLISPARLFFVLKVTLRCLRPSIIYSVPCDRIMQRAYCEYS